MQARAAAAAAETMTSPATTVDLSHRRLSRLDLLGQYPVVRRLDLSHNDLALLDGLQGCALLERVDLSYNRLPRLDSLALLTRIRVLVLSHNGIKRLDLRGREVPHLETLDASHNQIVSVDGIAHLTRLEHLNLAHNRLTSFVDLQANKALKSCNLDGNLITSLATAPVALPSSLQTLTLANNSVSDILSAKLLANLDALHELDLSGNAALDTARSWNLNHRPFVLFLLPTLQVLDGQAISAHDASLSRTLFCDETGELVDMFVRLLQPGMESELLEHLLARTPLRNHHQLGMGGSPAGSPPRRAATTTSARSSPASGGGKGGGTRFSSSPVRRGGMPVPSFLASTTMHPGTMAAVASAGRAAAEAPDGSGQPGDEFVPMSEFRRLQQQVKEMRRFVKSLLLAEARKQERAATAIQALFRGFMVRRRFAILLRTPTAKTKRKPARKSARKELTLPPWAVSIDAVHVSTAPPRSTVRRSFVSRSSGLVRWQAIVRGVLVRRRLHEARALNSAAIRIQAAWRGYRVRRHFGLHSPSPAPGSKSGGGAGEAQVAVLEARLAALEDAFQRERHLRLAQEDAMRLMWQQLQQLHSLVDVSAPQTNDA